MFRFYLVVEYSSAEHNLFDLHRPECLSQNGFQMEKALLDPGAPERPLAEAGSSTSNLCVYPVLGRLMLALIFPVGPQSYSS